MDNRTANAIILIRQNAAVSASVTDAEIERLIGLGDTLRGKMRPDIEVEYDDVQELAIQLSTLCEVANDETLSDFDFDKFDKEFENEFGDGERPKVA